MWKVKLVYIRCFLRVAFPHKMRLDNICNCMFTHSLLVMPSPMCDTCHLHHVSCIYYSVFAINSISNSFKVYSVFDF